eukprot:TRINITY_DN67273_c4_g2_i2.p1 TRINITY_DN67273_c4_g2~~TRINITY_DN67273_c4_g2_i2.p1  ORF type:complete len:984 (-),score=141.09 TRINITY_DN67273_c4_g2_i2:620-3175(-)
MEFFAESRKRLGSITIQAFARWRLSINTRYTQVLTDYAQTKTKAAVTMQSWWRGTETRTQLKHKRTAAEIIQRMGRGHAGRRAFHMRKVNTTTMALARRAMQLAKEENEKMQAERKQRMEEKQKKEEAKQQRKANLAAKRQAKREQRLQQEREEKERQEKEKQRQEKEREDQRKKEQQAIQARIAAERLERERAEAKRLAAAEAQAAEKRRLQQAEQEALAKKQAEEERLHGERRETPPDPRSKETAQKSAEYNKSFKQQVELEAAANSSTPTITLTRTDAAERIQRMTRVHSSMKLTMQLRAERNAKRKAEEDVMAAQHIQRIFRGHASRLHVVSRHKSQPDKTPTIVVSKSAAAERIQRALRMKFARTKTKTKRQERENRRRREEEVLAVQNIQRLFRGHAGRLIAIQKHVAHVEKENQAATSIQKIHRGRQARKEVETRRQLFDVNSDERSAIIIQRIGRGYKARNGIVDVVMADWKAKHQAATNVQKIFRGYHARKEVRQRALDATGGLYEDGNDTLFDVANVGMSGIEETRRISAAINIQRTWRGHRVRARMQTTQVKTKKKPKGKPARQRTASTPTSGLRGGPAAHRERHTSNHSHHGSSLLNKGWNGFTGERNLTEAEKRHLMSAVTSQPSGPPLRGTASQARRLSGLKAAGGPKSKPVATGPKPAGPAAKPQQRNAIARKQRDVINTMPPQQYNGNNTMPTPATKQPAPLPPQVGRPVTSPTATNMDDWDYSDKVARMQETYQQFMAQSVNYSQHGALFVELEQMSKHHNGGVAGVYDQDVPYDDTRSIGSGNSLGGGGYSLPPLRRAVGYERGKHLHAVQQKQKSGKEPQTMQPRPMHQLAV